MKVVVIGGSGLIGKKLIAGLKQGGHEALSASPSSGVNTLTGEGLAEALAGANVVVDVSNSPSFEDAAVLKFFETSTRNIAAAAKAAGVGHYVAASVVGADRMPNIGYMRAKVAEETGVKASGVPYTIMRATQFFEFVGAIVAGGTVGDVVKLSPAMMRPIAADDVAAKLLEIVLAAPINGIVDIAGPDLIRMDELGRRYLKAHPDGAKSVVADPAAGYFGAPVDDQSLIPIGPARVGAIRFDDWLAGSQ